MDMDWDDMVTRWVPSDRRSLVLESSAGPVAETGECRWSFYALADAQTMQTLRVDGVTFIAAEDAAENALAEGRAFWKR